jgi:hypothetical protein
MTTPAGRSPAVFFKLAEAGLCPPFGAETHSASAMGHEGCGYHRVHTLTRHLRTLRGTGAKRACALRAECLCAGGEKTLHKASISRVSAFRVRFPINF